MEEWDQCLVAVCAAKDEKQIRAGRVSSRRLRMNTVASGGKNDLRL